MEALSFAAQWIRQWAVPATRTLLAATALTIFQPASLPAQTRPATRENVAIEPVLQRAREISLTAKTTAEYQQIIRLCRQAERQQLSPTSVAYMNQLLGWTYNRRGELNVEDAAALAAEGQRNEAKKLDAQALEDFETAVKYDPGRWKVYQNRGVCYAAVGNTARALADFSHVIKLEPEYSNAWFNRAELRYDRREYEKAITDYTEVIRLKTDDVAALTGRGHAHFHLAQFREAMADYEQTVKLSPNDPNPLTNRADTEVRLGKWQNAADDYRQAAELDPTSARAYQGIAWLMSTCPDESMRNPNLAIQAAKKALELEGRDEPKLLDTLAAAHANAGHFDEAKALVARAVNLSTEDDVEPLKVRMAMYEQKEPYRLGRVKTVKPQR